MRMGMTQVIFGAALGFILAQSVLYGLRRSIDWLPRGPLLARMRMPSPVPGSAIAGVLIRYAGLLGVCAALLTLGTWAVGDYLKARSAQRAAMVALSEAATAPGTGTRAAPEDVTRLAAASEAPSPTPLVNADPYADPAFKVPRRAHRSGATASLTDTFLERSEAKARSDLLDEIRQHSQRSQYDCEAAARADKYLKAGLDVWGFQAWQGKYFPVGTYKGATLPECKALKNVTDPAALDLRSTVAQQHSS